MLALSCDLGEVQGLFCKSANTHDTSPPWAAPMGHYARAACVGRVGPVQFLFFVKN